MTKIITHSVVLFIGFLLGAYALSRAYNLEVDLLTLPHTNKPVTLDMDMHLQQGDIKLIIPAGAEILYKYNYQSVPYYSLPIIGNDDVPQVNSKSQTKFFWEINSIANGAQ